MLTNNFFTIKNNKPTQKAIAWCLIVLMLFGMIPNFGVTAVQAAESTPAVNLSDLIDKNGGSVTIPVNETAVGPKIVSHRSPGGTAGYLAEYNTSGVHGYGYCLQHWLGASNGMNIQLNEAKKETGLLANVFYLGFTDNSHAAKTQFVTDLAMLADKITQEAGKGNVLSPDWATWLHGLPDDKANEYWRKATQLAVWMASDTAGGKPNMILEDQLVYKDGTVKSAYSNLEGDGFDYIKNSSNSSDEAQHVLKAAKALYLVASYFTAQRFDITQREAKMVTYPIQRGILTDSGFYSGDTVDFKSSNDANNGNIVTAFDKGCDAIVEKDGFYEIYYMTVSQTQFGGTMRISIADTSQNLPSGTVLKGLTKEDCMSLGIDEDYAFPDKSGQSIELIMKKENIAPANNTDSGFGIIDLPMSGNYDENRKLNYPCYYKLCIPTSSVSKDDTTPVSIDIDTQCTSLYKYDLYRGVNNNSNQQDFALGDTVAADTNHNSVVWAGAESVITPILEKKSSDGGVLSGVTFKFDGPTSTSLTTDSSGKISAQWTNSSASNYLAPGSYTVTETSVPAGYKKDTSVKTITLNADGSSSGMLTFTNVPDPHNSEGVIKKISTAGIGLAGAVFEFTSTSGAGGGTYTSDSDGVVPVQWTDKNKPNYIAPGTYMVKEITPPPGYNLDSGGAQQITLYADGKVSGQLVFVNSKKPSLLVYKSDENGNPLPGAVFTVWKDGQEMGTVGPTGADGYAEVENVENGYYEFQEYTAPAGYLLSTEKKRINVDVDSIVGELAVNVVTFKNYDEPTIHLMKVDESGNGLPGAVIELKIDGQDAGQYVTGTDGSVEVTYDQIKGYLDMSRDTWTVEAREVTPPEGYLLNDDDWHTIEMTRGQDPAQLVFTDSIYPELLIRKVDRGTNTGLDGAKFEVRIDGATIGTYTTENGGQIVIDYDTYNRFLDDLNNPDKTWTVSVREVAAPDGYLIDDINWQEQRLTLGEALEPFVFVDTKYPDIEIYKLDRGTNTGLEGAKFEVKIDDHTIGTFPTDKDGKILIDYETYKRFLGDITNPEKKAWTIAVREVAAPDGFLIDDDNWQIQELILGQDLAPFIFTDSEYGDILIKKLERGTIKGLEGAVFEVMIDTTKIGEYTTNKFGEILISYEEYERFLGDLADSDKDKNAWTVHVREVVPPDGYLLDDEEWHVAEYRIGEKVKPFVFTDTQYPDILIKKLDNGTKEGLDGAVFQLTINGTMVDEFVTENGGIIRIPYETYGRYLGDQTNPEQIEWTVGVREVTAPDGYLIDDDNWHYGQLKIGEKLETFVFTDTKYPDIKIIKLDRETGERLPNTSFRIVIDGTSFVAEKKTDENGEIIITYAEYGHFLTESGDKDRDMWTITVTELEPTQYYNKDKQQTSGDYTQTQQLKHGQSLSVFEFKDTHYRDVKVYKYDS